MEHTCGSTAGSGPPGGAVSEDALAAAPTGLMAPATHNPQARTAAASLGEVRDREAIRLAGRTHPPFEPHVGSTSLYLRQPTAWRWPDTFRTVGTNDQRIRTTGPHQGTSLLLAAL